VGIFLVTLGWAAVLSVPYWRWELGFRPKMSWLPHRSVNGTIRSGPAPAVPGVYRGHGLGRAPQYAGLVWGGQLRLVRGRSLDVVSIRGKGTAGAFRVWVWGVRDAGP